MLHSSCLQQWACATPYPFLQTLQRAQPLPLALLLTLPASVSSTVQQGWRGSGCWAVDLIPVCNGQRAGARALPVSVTMLEEKKDHPSPIQPATRKSTSLGYPEERVQGDQLGSAPQLRVHLEPKQHRLAEPAGSLGHAL